MYRSDILQRLKRAFTLNTKFNFYSIKNYNVPEKMGEWPHPVNSTPVFGKYSMLFQTITYANPVQEGNPYPTFKYKWFVKRCKTCTIQVRSFYYTIVLKTFTHLASLIFHHGIVKTQVSDFRIQWYDIYSQVLCDSVLNMYHEYFLWPSNSPLSQWIRQSLVPIVACRLFAPGYYLDQCWLIAN